MKRQTEKQVASLSVEKGTYYNSTKTPVSTYPTFSDISIWFRLLMLSKLSNVLFIVKMGGGEYIATAILGFWTRYYYDFAYHNVISSRNDVHTFRDFFHPFIWFVFFITLFLNVVGFLTVTALLIRSLFVTGLT